MRVRVTLIVGVGLLTTAIVLTTAGLLAGGSAVQLVPTTQGESLTVGVSINGTPRGTVTVVVEGQAARLTLKDANALTLLVLAGEAGAVLRVSELVTDPSSGLTAPTLLLEAPFAPDVPVSLDHAGSVFRFDWIRSEQVAARADSQLQTDDPIPEGCTQCCVECDGFEVCAHEVILECGSCRCPNESPAAGGQAAVCLAELARR